MECSTDLKSSKKMKINYVSSVDDQAMILFSSSQTFVYIKQNLKVSKQSPGFYAVEKQEKPLDPPFFTLLLI